MVLNPLRHSPNSNLFFFFWSIKNTKLPKHIVVHLRVCIWTIMCKTLFKITKHGNENIRSIKISNIKVQVQTSRLLFCFFFPHAKSKYSLDLICESNKKKKQNKIWHIESILCIRKKNLPSKLILLKSKLLRISDHTRCCQLKYIYKCSAGIFIDSLSRLLKFSKLNLKNKTKQNARIEPKTKPLLLNCVVNKIDFFWTLMIVLIKFSFRFYFILYIFLF